MADDFETIGITQAPGYSIPLASDPAGAIACLPSQRLRLMLLVCGSAHVLVNGAPRMLNGPSLFCINDTEKVDVVSAKGTEVSCLVFHPSVVSATFNFENIRQPLPPTALSDRDCLWSFVHRAPNFHGMIDLGPASLARVRNLFFSTARTLSEQSDGYWPCRARSYFIELLLFVDRLAMRDEVVGAPYVRTLSGHDQLASDVIHYLQSRYQQDISVALLCKEFATNHTTLSKAVRAATGSSVMSYLRQHRLRVAAAVIRETTLPVHEVIERTGFRDATHFGRAFKEQHKLTPLQYRARYHVE